MTYAVDSTGREQLAVDGGKPVRKTLLPYGRQSIDEADIQAVVETLKSDWLTTGPKVAEFEQARRLGRSQIRSQLQFGYGRASWSRFCRRTGARRRSHHFAHDVCGHGKLHPLSECYSDICGHIA